MKKLFLASASPRRHEILEKMKLPHIVFVAEADETLPDGISPTDAGSILAARKAMAVKEELIKAGLYSPETLILAADTLVYIDNKPLGKPKNADDALNMLLALSGKKHSVCTGTCLIYKNRSISSAEVSDVYMRNFSEAEAKAYVATKEPLDKAGAYGIQGIGSVLVDHIDGDFFSIMGLSPTTVSTLMSKLGIPYFDLIQEK